MNPPGSCSVCAHAAVDAIDRSLLTGESTRAIARQFDVGKDALGRHRADHLPEHLASAADAEQVAGATDLLLELRLLRMKTNRILTRCEQSGDNNTALRAIREARAFLELLFELEGKLNRGVNLTILQAPEWVTIRTTLLETLAPFPEARAAVGASLLSLESASGYSRN